MNAAKAVLDASLALKWVVAEPYSVEAVSLVDEVRSQPRKLLASALILYEVTNALTKQIQRDQLTLSDASRCCAFLWIAVPWSDKSEPSARARTHGAIRTLPAYDAHYIALAEPQRAWVKALAAWVFDRAKAGGSSAAKGSMNKAKVLSAGARLREMERFFSACANLRRWAAQAADRARVI